MEIIIKNGYVYDPLNNIKGEKTDIAIKDGKIVSPSGIDETEAKIIDASGKVVMPGGVDLHTHIAGTKVNLGRLMTPEEHHKFYLEAIPGIRRSGTGITTPSTMLVGYQYAKMGWTTAIEPAAPPLKIRHTHEELDDTPILDKACFVLLDSNRFILEFLEKGEIAKCAAFVAWMLKATKSYAIKLVDPGVAVLWNFGRGYGLDIDDQISPYNLTPREIVEGLCKVSQMLKLPHPIHVHCNKLGIPGNFETTLETMKTVSKYAQDEKINIHITHAQFNSYGGVDWTTLKTRAEKIAKYVNSVNHVSLDTGQIAFGNATTMTADAPFEYALYHITKWKWGGSEVENEAAAGVVPLKYKRNNFVHALQWCIGLELALLVKDPWKVIMTTDHPNGAPFTKYPTVISWLMSKNAREKIIEKLNKKAVRTAILPSIEREYTLYEIAIITRAAPAKLLGIHYFKGHLGIGADADVAIYDINPKEIDFSKDYEAVEKAFQKALYTIKNGEIVARNGEILQHNYGRTYYVNVKVKEDLMENTLTEVKSKFKEWYTISFENYEIHDYELRNPYPIKLEV